MLKAKQIQAALKKSELAVDRGYQGEFEVGDGCLIYKDDADSKNPGWAYRHNRKMGGGSGPIDDMRDLKQFIAQVKQHSAKTESKGGDARVFIEKDRISGAYGIYVSHGNRQTNISGDIFTKKAAKKEAAMVRAQLSGGWTVKQLSQMMFDKHYKTESPYAENGAILEELCSLLSENNVTEGLGILGKERKGPPSAASVLKRAENAGSMIQTVNTIQSALDRYAWMKPKDRKILKAALKKWNTKLASHNRFVTTGKR